jgi:hypothetical protein
MSSFVDSRGCLTNEGLDALAGAPVGQAPPEAAAHLARCTRCQERLLQRGREATARGKRGEARPFRNLAVFATVLLVMLLMLGITLVVVSGR